MKNEKQYDDSDFWRESEPNVIVKGLKTNQSQTNFYLKRIVKSKDLIKNICTLVIIVNMTSTDEYTTVANHHHKCNRWVRPPTHRSRANALTGFCKYKGTINNHKTTS